MAASQNGTQKRSNIATGTSTPQSRGKVINGRQTEEVYITKLTGDTTATLTLGSIKRPTSIHITPLLDSAGAKPASFPFSRHTNFVRTSDTVIALSGLGDWTYAKITVLGRSSY